MAFYPSGDVMQKLKTYKLQLKSVILYCEKWRDKMSLLLYLTSSSHMDIFRYEGVSSRVDSVPLKTPVSDAAGHDVTCSF